MGKFYKLTPEVIEGMSSLSRAEILVYSWLKSSDPYGHSTEINTLEISKALKITRRSVQRSLISLHKQGFIELPESYAIHANTEQQVRNRLKAELGGLSEVSTPVGRIDLLTDTEIIEVKRIDDWKGALGQLLVYSGFYPSHKKRLHLFGSQKDMDKILNIELSCMAFDVQVTFEALSLDDPSRSLLQIKDDNSHQ